jgi:cytosine/creatinine deaminase
VFEMAQHYDAPIDLHADFADDMADQRFATAEYIARKTIDYGYQGRVSLGHVTSLGSLPAAELEPIVTLLREAAISIVTLPATDLYLGGRRDEFNQRRGLTPVRALYNGGVNVAYSSNNIRNAFTPFGTVDMLQVGNLLAHVVQFGTPEHQAAILDMGTRNAAAAIGLASEYGIGVGRVADFVILDTFKVADALLDIPARLWVIKRGKITVVTEHRSTIQLSCSASHSNNA